MKVRKKKDPVLWSLLANEDLVSWLAARDFLLENGREEEVRDLDLEINCLEFMYSLQKRFKYATMINHIDDRKVSLSRSQTGNRYWLRVRYKHFWANRETKQIQEETSFTTLFGVQISCIMSPEKGYMGNLARKFTDKIRQIRAGEIRNREWAEDRLKKMLEEEVA